MQESVYKICKRDIWRQATETGELSRSHDDLRDGYVHLSAGNQVRATLGKHFRTERELILLEIPVERLPPGTLKWERSATGESFPHLYATLCSSYVTRVHELHNDMQGVPVLPTGL
jgi:uncharacterized protein (DUF952 family)